MENNDETEFEQMDRETRTIYYQPDEQYIGIRGDRPTVSQAIGYLQANLRWYQEIDEMVQNSPYYQTITTLYMLTDYREDNEYPFNEDEKVSDDAMNGFDDRRLAEGFRIHLARRINSIRMELLELERMEQYG
jgi:hypothetical protein|tara:strand:+ start:46 stop:444 length:399 start_codon:yes stop_codon:yes gene_type:complete